MRQAPKMTDIVIEETSGVDHPAHMHEGWLVIKSSYVQSGAEVQESLKEAAMPEGEAEKADYEMEPEDQAKADDLAMAMARIAELEARIAEMEGAMDAEASMPAEDMEESAEAQLLELAKSTPAPVREMLANVLKAKQSAEAELLKERESRADDAATTKAAGMFKHLGIDPALIGPALRRLDMQDAALAKAVTDALVTANAQNESASIFSEIGVQASSATDSYQKLVSLAKAAVAEGRVQSIQQGIALAASTNPALYNEYLAEKGA